MIRRRVDGLLRGAGARVSVRATSHRSSAISYMGNGSTAALRYEVINYTEILGSLLARKALRSQYKEYLCWCKGATVQENISQSII